MHHLMSRENTNTVRSPSTTHPGSKIPIVYVNQVGGQDELIFDGGSMVIAADGNVPANAPQFEETVIIADIEPTTTTSDEADIKIPLDSKEYDPPQSQLKHAFFQPLEPLSEIWKALCLATSDYLRKNNFTDVVIGLSGGIDSAIVATIAADALGSEHVHTVALPSRFPADTPSRTLPH